MKRICLLLFVLSFILSSCQTSTGTPSDTKSKNEKIKSEVTDLQLSSIIAFPDFGKKKTSKYDRIIISRYQKRERPFVSDLRDYKPFTTEEILDVDLNQFEVLLTKGRKTGYCCCPERDYQIIFFNGAEETKRFFINKNSSKTQIRIYQRRYQFSYLIDKVIWNEFISNQKKIDFSIYNIREYSKSQEAFEYLISKRLPNLTSETTSLKWMEFEGEFNVSISTVDKKISEEDIYKNIYKQYPNGGYKIETIGKYKMCGSINGHDCYEEYVLRIYCNKDFHDKFNTYLPKSYFDEAVGAFMVLGDSSELSKMEKLFAED
jgi:predicted small secreted protein